MNITGLLRKWAAVLPFFLFIVPFHALAAEPEEMISINININMDWNHRGSGTTRTIGTYMVKVTGKARLTEKDGEWLRYEPVGMRATGKFKQETIQEAEGSDCFGQVIMRIDGFDTVPVTTGEFLINGNLGNLGRMAAMQYKGDFSPGEMFSQKKDARSDNYSSLLVAGFKITQRGGCGNEGYIKEGTFPIALNIFKELTPMGMHGSYTWKSKDGLPSFKIDVGDFQGDRRFNPIKGQGARYRVSWRFGKITPIVQIWYKGKNITDRKNDVLVGEKVKLEAVVKPHWMSGEKGKWKIDKKFILEDWKASAARSDKIEAKLDKKEIEFFWWKQNDAEIVKYILNGKDVKAQTEFNVIEPNVEIIPTASNDFGYNPEDCEIVPGSPSMRIKSVVKLKEDKPFCLQYVQLVKSNNWSLKCAGKHFCWYNNVHEKKLDTSYPYGHTEEDKGYEGEKCGSGNVTIVMRDTPNGPMEKYAASLYMDEHFEAYLMFRPGGKEDGNAWVPLKRLDWQWKAKLISKVNPFDYRTKDKYTTGKEPIPLCKDRYNPSCLKAPAKYDHTPKQAQEYPEWSAVAPKNIFMEPTGQTVIDDGNNYKQSPVQWSCDDKDR